MAFTPKPHVSAALQHLRLGVAAAGLAVVLAMVLQMFVFGFVHYTDVRWTTLEDTGRTRELRVVQSNAGGARSLTGKGSAVGADPAAKPEPAPATVTADANRVPSRNDGWLAATSGLARSLGTVGALVMMILMLQGVVIAGGASVPGVERAVGAATWSIVIAFLCLPISAMLPGVPFRGALPSYEWLTASSGALRAGSPDAPGGTTFFGSALLAPIVVLAAAALVVMRFHAGVEQGVIATSVSELDDKLRREMSSIKVGATNAPRSVGALNRAMGETPPAAPAPPLARITPEDERPIGRPIAGDSLRRPI